MSPFDQFLPFDSDDTDGGMDIEVTDFVTVEMAGPDWDIILSVNTEHSDDRQTVVLLLDEAVLLRDALNAFLRCHPHALKVEGTS